MDIKKLILAAVPALMLASCSNEELDGGMSGGDGGHGGFKGDGYVSVSINLPTQPISRAANDSFDDGTPNEYAVTDGVLLLFRGDTEAGAMFHSAYDLGSLTGNNEGDATDNITTTFSKTVKVQDINIATNEHLYGLVMLNYKNVVTLAGTDVMIGGNDFQGSFSALLNETVNANLIKNGDNDYFFMTNSPLANKIGGTTAPTTDAKVYTLVDLTGKLKSTEAEAEDVTPKATVYVERAVAKASLAVSATSANISQSDGSTKGLTISKVEWMLDNTEPSSYVVRNISGDFDAWKGYASEQRQSGKYYRFVGSAAVGSLSGTEHLYRTYWCVDPQYDKGAVTMTTNTVFNELTKSGDKFTGSPSYCYENTFNVANMDYRNTTRAVLKVTYDNSGASLYTINHRDDQIFTKLRDASSKARAYVVESQEVRKAFEDALKPNQSVQINDYVRIRFTRNDATGVLQATAIDIKDYTQIADVDADGKPIDTSAADCPFVSVPALAETVSTDLLKRVNDRFVITEYKNGESYYDVRFKHFGGNGVTDQYDYTPWTSDGAASNTTDAYGTAPDSERDYLGRYGMVRNNWYDVNVTAFKSLGSPVVPDAKVTTSDDNESEEKWISFQVKVLSWAKRTQDHEF